MADVYWDSSDIKALNFDDDESSDQILGISVEGAARLSQQLKDGLKLDGVADTDSLSGQYGSLKGAPKYELLQLITEKSLNAILEADSAEFQITKSSLKPDEELRLLRREVQSRWDTPDPNSVVKSIALGQPFSLELFQSLQSKNDLLNAAIHYGDGDAILEVTLFLSKTLKKSLFQQIMFNCPVAVSHFIYYLSTVMQLQEATDLLELLGRHKEASFKQFALVSSNPSRHLARLKTLGAKFFFDSKDKIFVDNFARLIECQTEIKEEVGGSVVSTLSNLCGKNWNNSSTSPFILSKEHCVSDKQFQWTLLNARAAHQDWDNIQAMFITKGWLGAKKIKSAIPIDQIVLQLHKYKTPERILSMYLELVEDTEQKLSLAKKLQCSKVIIDTFANQRDRQSLKSYMASLSPQGDNFIYAESVLGSTIKWKN